MSKDIKLPYDKLCEYCFYNLQGICKRDPITCDYNKEIKKEGKKDG